jgi:hypothetical protein
VLAWYCADSIVPRRQVQLGFAVLNTEAEHAGQLDLITTVLDEHKSDILVLIVVGRPDGFRKELDARLGRRKAVVLGEADLKHIALSADPAQAVRLRVVEQLPLSLIGGVTDLHSNLHSNGVCPTATSLTQG